MESICNFDDTLVWFSASKCDRRNYARSGQRLRRTRGSLLLTQGDTPVDAIYVYSTLGTTVNVHEGTVAAFL